MKTRVDGQAWEEYLTGTCEKHTTTEILLRMSYSLSTTLRRYQRRNLRKNNLLIVETYCKKFTEIPETRHGV